MLTKIILESVTSHKLRMTAAIFLLLNRLIMITYLKVRKDRLVGDIQEDFNSAFPYLKIEFYKKNGTKAITSGRQAISKGLSLSNAGLLREGLLKIDDSMSVGELEHIFCDEYGANVQVSRKSGSLWLETTMTDKWTLKQQNDHGRELSVPDRKNASNDEVDYA